MTFSRLVNTGLALLVAMLALFAGLVQWETRQATEAMRTISHAANPAHSDMMTLKSLLNSAELALEIYRRRDVVHPDSITGVLDELHARISVRRNETGDTTLINDLWRTVAAARNSWLDAVDEYAKEPTGDTLTETIIALKTLFSSTRDALGRLQRLASPDHGLTGIDQQWISTLGSLLGVLEAEFFRFEYREVIDFDDVLTPVRLARNALRGKKLLDPDDEVEQRLQANAEVSVEKLYHAIQLVGEFTGSARDSSPTGSIASSMTALKATQLAVRDLAKRIVANSNALEKRRYTELERIEALRHVLTGGGLMVAIAVSVLLGRALARRVNRLVDGTRRFGQGDLSHRIARDTHDQFGQLADSFNDMAARIQDKERQQSRFIVDLAETKQQAEQANVAKSEFLAAMSHEIRTPINGVLGTADLLLCEELTRTQRHLAETIDRSGRALLGIINDILDFSKIEAGKLDLEEVGFDLHQLADDVCEMAASGAHGKGLDLTCMLDPAVPVQVVGDPIRLRQVLSNLVGNAVKFTSEGEVTLAVSCCESSGAGAGLRFEIQDTGIGIPEAAREHIFDSFAQADHSTTRRHGGTGLGLAISKQLVELMGGRLQVESVPNAGTRFWFELNVAVGAGDADYPLDDAGFAGVRALLVGADTNTRRDLANRLRMLGVASAERDRGQTALAELRRAALAGAAGYDIVFIDTRLTDMSGLEFAHILAAAEGIDPGPYRVAMQTFRDDPGLASAWRAAEPNARLVKPVRQSALYNCLSEFSGARADYSFRVPQAAATRPEILPRPVSVLVAEDHAVNQDVIVRMLKLLGCTVHLAVDGQTALDMLGEIPVELVFMDCDMPGMDGLEATTQRRELERSAGLPRMPIVALTANALSGDRERCMAAGMDDYLSKPVTTVVLRKAILRWIADEAGASNLDGVDARNAQSSGQPAGDSTTIPAPLDEAVVSGLEAMDDGGADGFLLELIDSYKSSWVRDFAALGAAFAANDAERARKTAHRIKSSSANLGGVRVANLCQEIETACGRGECTAAASQLRQLESEYARVVHALEVRLEKAA